MKTQDNTVDLQKEKQRIRSRASILALGILTLVIALDLVIYHSQIQTRIEKISSQQSASIASASHILTEEIASLDDLVRALHDTLRPDSSQRFEDRESRQLLAEQFRRFGASINAIHQIRWVDERGQELVRVNFDSARNARITPDEQLQNKQSRYYIQRGMQHPPHQVYLSPIDLNMEAGKLEVPYRPTLRATYRTGVEDQLPNGLLIINFDLTRAFDFLAKLSEEHNTLRIANMNGYWLLHEDPEKTWGWLRDNLHYTLARNEPGIWSDMLGLQSRQGAHLVREAHDDIWTLTRHDIQRNNVEDGEPGSNRLFLISSTAAGKLSELKWQVALPIVIATLLTGIVAIILWYHEIAQQLQRLQLMERIENDKSLLANSFRQLEDAFTQQRLLQEELVENRKLSALGLAVAGVAHEINTPAGGASITVSTLLQNLETIDPAEVPAGKIQQLVDTHTRGLKLVQKQLKSILTLVSSYKRLALERSHDQPEFFPVMEMLDDLLTVLRPQLKAHAMQVVVHGDQTLQMQSIPGALSQVLQNLITNAVSHAFENKAGEELHIEVTQPQDGQVQITVSDNGRGIPEEKQRTVFDPFETSGRGRGHSGLGLYMVHRWVTETLQGKIQISSSVGQGATFTLYLPQRLQLEQPESTAA